MRRVRGQRRFQPVCAGKKRGRVHVLAHAKNQHRQGHEPVDGRADFRGRVGCGDAGPEIGRECGSGRTFGQQAAAQQAGIGERRSLFDPALVGQQDMHTVPGELRPAQDIVDRTGRGPPRQRQGHELMGE